MGINHFMNQLQIYKDDIKSKNQQRSFYRRFGLGYKKEWLDGVRRHNLLFAKSECDDGRLIIDRLVRELKIIDFAGYSVLLKSSFVSKLQLNDGDRIAYLEAPQNIDQKYQKQILQFKYFIADGDDLNNDDGIHILRFSAVNQIQFVLPYNLESNICSIYAQKSDDNFVSIKQLNVERKEESEIDYFLHCLK